MKAKLYIYTLLLSTVSCTCEDNPPRPLTCAERQQQLTDKGMICPNSNRCIVLCDFSSSMDSTSVQTVKQYAQTILANRYQDATITFYSVSNASRKPFFEAGGLEVRDSSFQASDFRQLQHCMDTFRNRSQDTLRMQLADASRNRQRATYLIQSIAQAIEDIRILDPEQKRKNTIFILSDMKESGVSDFGKYNLDAPDYPSALAAVRNAPEKSDLPDSLEKNIEFQIGYLTAGQVSPKQLKEFWDIVFRKFHYHRPIHLSATLSFRR